VTATGADVEEYVRGVRAGSRRHVARAITLVESTLPEHRRLAQRMLVALLPHAGGAHRVGITGVPGVGKSTFIDALGVHLTGAGERVAVLAVDPSSTRRGGSILGDKTRMARLAVDPAAFIRPSPTAGTLGGVARATREAIVVLEAAGFGVVLVETVGVGQSETAVANMVDTFLLLMIARTGDSLQGIKKGVLELAEVIAVNKADGEHVVEARVAARELCGPCGCCSGPRMLGVPVLTCSAVEDVVSPRCGRRWWSTAPAWRHPASWPTGGPARRSTGCGRWCMRACWRACARTPGSSPSRRTWRTACAPATPRRRSPPPRSSA